MKPVSNTSRCPLLPWNPKPECCCRTEASWNSMRVTWSHCCRQDTAHGGSRPAWRQDLKALYAGIRAVEGGVGRAAITPEISLALWLYATIDGVAAPGESPG